MKKLLQDNINFSIDKLPIDKQQDMYFDFFFNTNDFIYNIWNLKILDYDLELNTEHKIKTSVLEDNFIVNKDTIKEELSKLSLEEQLEKLFFNKEDFITKFKFYLNYMEIHNSFLQIKIETLLDLNSDLEELSIFFSKKI